MGVVFSVHLWVWVCFKCLVKFPNMKLSRNWQQSDQLYLLTVCVGTLCVYVCVCACTHVCVCVCVCV